MSVAKDEIVRGEIIDQAQKLFKQFGLKKTTMDEIATACGKAKSTLYHYYKSKEEVFDAVIERELVNLRRIVKDKVDKEKSIKDKAVAYVISFHEGVVNKMNLYRIVKQEFLNDKSAKIHFKKVMAFEKSYITRLLEDGYDSGEWSAVPREDLSWFAEIVIAAFLGIVKYTIESDSGFDQEKLDRTARSLVPKIFG